MRCTPSWLVSALLPALLAAAPQAQSALRSADLREFAVPGKAARGRVWTASGADGRPQTFTSVSLDGVRFGPARETRYELELRYRRFDPRAGAVEVADALRARPDNRLFVVQYWTQGLEDYRDVLRELGGEVHLYLAHHANVIELDPALLAAVRALPFVRAVTPFHPAYKLEEELHLALREGRTGALRVNVLTTHGEAVNDVVAWVAAHGGSCDEVSPEARFLVASIAYELVPELAGLDPVQWIDRWGPRVPLMDIAREFHGADHVEALHGLTGTDVRVEVLDFGCDTSHPDLQNFMLHGSNSVGAHGTCTAGIVTGDGIGNPGARGAAPDSFLIVADLDFGFGGGSRYTHTSQLVNATFRCVVQSNSWISLPESSAYNSTASALDTILFDRQRISIVQGQGNTGDNVCGRECWAKNAISVGGLYHDNSLTASDDSWSDGASIGPAADGRIKPDLASFYDGTLCTDVMGGGGYNPNGNYFGQFGGTSCATPITAGHLALIYEMWHLGMFGNPHPGPTPFDNAPFNTTAKALLINSATQWGFSGAAHDRTRTHQGWGHADLQKLSDALARIFVVDESDLLTNLQSKDYVLEVLPGQASLQATLVYRDPAGTTSSTLHRINDLDLTLTSPSSVVYHGNFGLLTATTSSSGGTADPLNTVENVILNAPESGLWTVTVTATDLNQDNHVETPGLDADFALVVRGAKEPSLVPPLAPAHLRGRAAAHVARLEFDDNSLNETGFELERSPDGIAFAPLATLAANDTDHVDPGLTPDALYYYRVRAFNGIGPSAWSNVLALRAHKTDER